MMARRITKFAADSRVPVSQTRAEIENTLQKFGATSFAYAMQPDRAIIMFEAQDRRIRFELPLRKLDTTAKTDKHHRERWRALLLTIKSRLVSVDVGIEEFETAFMAHVVMPDGRTAGDLIRPQIAAQYKGGNMPLMLAGPGPKS